jgi:hypothetical protein
MREEVRNQAGRVTTATGTPEGARPQQGARATRPTIACSAGEVGALLMIRTSRARGSPR